MQVDATPARLYTHAPILFILHIINRNLLESVRTARTETHMLGDMPILGRTDVFAADEETHAAGGSVRAT